MAKTFKDLIVWQEAKKLINAVYCCTHIFPATEKHGLTSQMRRAAVSIAANIAEGWGCHSTDKQFLQFLNMANGSLSELDCYIELCADLNLLRNSDKQTLEEQIRRLSYLINRFRDKLK